MPTLIARRRMLRAAPRVSSFCARCGGSSAHRRLSYTSSAPHRPRSERRRPSARSFCRAAAPLAPARRRIPARRRWRSCSRSRGARARTASRESPTLRPLCRPTRAGYREETDFRRSDPSVFEHGHHAVARVPQASAACGAPLLGRRHRWETGVKAGEDGRSGGPRRRRSRRCERPPGATGSRRRKGRSRCLGRAGAQRSFERHRPE